ncbi:MAG TPA: DinB family protein [Dehalococcoidia bacterium]|nr:DinB family protein [Dehalococcoidia bacterium]
MSYAAQARSLAAYNRWADERIVAASAALSDDALAGPCADGRSLRDTLRHALGTQLWWLGNWTGEPVAQPPHATADLSAAFARAHDRIDALVAVMDGARWAGIIEFAFPGAPALKLPMWQTFAQVMLHGVQHRTQAAEALTGLGHSPGDMDYILWLLRHGGA